MSMRLIAALACCTLAMGLTACNKSGKSAEAGAMKQGESACCGKCDGKASMGQVGDKTDCCGKCTTKDASMGAVGGECSSKAGSCSEKKDASMGAVGGECGSKAGSCSEKKDASMGAVSGKGSCGSKSDCSSKAGC